MNYSALFSSTALYTQPKYIVIFSSGTWPALKDCKVKISAFGGSASGAACRAGYYSATGGGAGARCNKTVDLKAGDVLTITIGAGGLGVSPPTNADNTRNGNDGGDTTVTGPDGLNMLAGGGKGGRFALGPTGADGGLGGLASGGDENLPGGRGGNIATAAAGNSLRGTGGGALPLNKAGHRGGDCPSTAGASLRLGTGGAGTGGNGGDIPAPTANTSTGGGGPHSAGASGNADSTTGGRSVLGLELAEAPFPLCEWIKTSGPGSRGEIGTGAMASPNAGNGGGSGGSVSTTSGAATSGAPGALSGSGAAVAQSGVTSSGGRTGNRMLVGGTGAAVTLANNIATSGDAGDGFVVLEVW